MRVIAVTVFFGLLSLLVLALFIQRRYVPVQMEGYDITETETITVIIPQGDEH